MVYSTADKPFTQHIASRLVCGCAPIDELQFIGTLAGRCTLVVIDEGVPEETAKELAATTISDGLKYVFAETDLESYAFFTVRQRGGAMVITLNTRHPAYHHLVEVLQRDENASDAVKLQNRLSRAADGLKLLLLAWARYEDEQPDGKLRTQAADARTDWGRMARRFLERED